MGYLWSDICRAVRNLRRSPGFALATLLSLSLGIGANMATFSIVNALLLRPTGVSDPARLVVVTGQMPGAESLRFSFFDFEELRRSGVPVLPYARSHWPVSLKGKLAPEVGLAAVVSGSYFSSLGASLALGRPFDSGELSPVAVISHRLWQSQFEADPGVIGKQVWINKRPFTVVGVAAPGFTGELAFMAIDAWAPLRMLDRIAPFPIDLLERTSRVVDIGARLQPGVTLAQARSALRIFCASLAERFPDSHSGISCSCDAGSSIRFPMPGMARGMRMFLVALSLVVGLLLLIACTNVAHLLMVRSTARQGEIAMRMALGSSRARIASHLLTESLLLGLVAGLGGMLVRLYVLDYLGAFKAPSPIPVALDLSVDWRVLAFTFGLAALTGILFGLLPALRASRLELAGVLREHPGAWQSSRGGNRAQTILVGTQVALSLVLVTAAALTLRSLGNALAFDPGFDVSHGVLAKFNLAYGNYSQQETLQFQQEALRRTRVLPGVASVGLSLFPPLDYSANQAQIGIPGYEARSDERLIVDLNFVSGDYFAAMGIPILRGRGIEDRDTAAAAGVAVVNQAMAGRFWPGVDPVGRTVFFDDREHRVIGVATDGKYFSLTEEPKSVLYVPMGRIALSYFSLHVRTNGPPESLVPKIAAELRLLDPDLPPVQVRTMRDHMKLSQYPATIAGISVGMFGVLALVMALTGVYGVMAYFVRMRVHEIGIRVALGAGDRDITRLVMAKGVRVLAIGLMVGLTASLVVNRLLAGVLVGVRPHDPLVLSGVSLVLAAALLLACYLPARKAVRLNPAASLRCE